MRGTGAWRHAFGSVTPEARQGFAAGGDAFTVTGAPIARTAFVVDAGVELNVGPNATLGLSYGGQLGSGATDQSVRGAFAVRF